MTLGIFKESLYKLLERSYICHTSIILRIENKYLLFILISIKTTFCLDLICPFIVNVYKKIEKMVLS